MAHSPPLRTNAFAGEHLSISYWDLLLNTNCEARGSYHIKEPRCGTKLR